MSEVPTRSPGVPFDVWLKGLTDRQLIDYAVRCARARRRVREEMVAWSDTFLEVMEALEERQAPDLHCELLGREFEIWLGDEDDQAEQQRDYQFRCQFERQVREMGWNP